MTLSQKKKNDYIYVPFIDGEEEEEDDGQCVEYMIITMVKDIFRELVTFYRIHHWFSKLREKSPLELSKYYVLKDIKSFPVGFRF